MDILELVDFRSYIFFHNTFNFQSSLETLIQSYEHNIIFLWICMYGLLVYRRFFRRYFFVIIIILFTFDSKSSDNCSNKFEFLHAKKKNSKNVDHFRAKCRIFFQFSIRRAFYSPNSLRTVILKSDDTSLLLQIWCKTPNCTTSKPVTNPKQWYLHRPWLFNHFIFFLKTEVGRYWPRACPGFLNGGGGFENFHYLYFVLI